MLRMSSRYDRITELLLTSSAGLALLGIACQLLSGSFLFSSFNNFRSRSWSRQKEIHSNIISNNNLYLILCIKYFDNAHIGRHITKHIGRHITTHIGRHALK